MAQTLRIKLVRSSSRQVLVDIEADATPPSFEQGTEIDLQIGVFDSDGTTVWNSGWLDLEGVILSLRSLEASGPVHFSRGITADEVNNGLTSEQWEAGTHEHFTISLNTTESNITAIGDITTLRLLVWGFATVEGVGVARTMMGGGEVEMIANGFGDDGLRPVSPFVTTAEAAQLLANALAELSVPSAGTTVPASETEAGNPCDMRVDETTGEETLFVRGATKWHRISLTPFGV